MKKTLASALSLSLILLSPGLASWAAAADVATGGAGARIAAPLALPASAVVGAPSSSLNIGAGLNAGVSLNAGVALANAAVPSAASALPSAAAPQARPAAPQARAAAGDSRPMAEIPGAVTPNAAAANAAQAPEGSLKDLVAHQSELSLSGEQASKLGAGQAKDAGASIMDRVLGLKAALHAGEAVEATPVLSSLFRALAPVGKHDGGGSSMQPPAPPSGPSNLGPSGNGPRGAGSKIVGALASLGRVALGVGVVLGLQAAGVALLPAIFGLTPVAAVWAVSSGVLLLPAAVFARYRLSLRDSPRLSKVKWLLDGAIGAFLGAVVVAMPAFGVVLATQGASIGLPLAAAAGAGSLISLMSGGNLVDVLLTGGAMAALPALIGVGAGALGLAPLIGMMALPVMTTITFFLGQIVTSAETGRPFSVPGSLQKFRFPAFNWVMIGVVFALTTGFSAVHANIAFLIWQFTGSKGMPTWDKKLPVTKNLIGLLTNFNVLYLGLLAFTAITAFHSPLTFIVIAFAGERAAVWTEGLLSKLLPASQAAPSSVDPAQDPASFSDRVERKWPAGYHWAKTFIMIGAMGAMAFGMGYWIVGIGSLLKNLAFASVLAALPLFLSKTLIKAVMKLKPATKESDPEFYEIMTEMRATINAQRAKKGKSPINLPELTVAPTDIPNAAATGLSPNKSLVFVTQGIKTMLLDPEELRDGLVRLLAGFSATSDEFKVFRMGLVGTIPGVTQQSAPQEAAQAVLRAGPEQLHTLGKRLLRGVLSHEFSHVMDRHMITGTIGGAISSGVAFASYGVMWAVGHAKVMTQKLKDRILGNPPKLQGDETDENRPGLTDGRGRGAKPEMLEPLSTGVVLKSLPALLRMFAALWAPIILQITQMAGSRNNEAMADEDGAKLSQDPAALALALGLLTTWRPRGFAISGLQLPRLAAVGHMMTVNPLLQLREAGVLPKTDVAGRPVTAADNFMLDLFLTHPDTLWRIRTLKKMADALGQDKNPPNSGAPPPSDKGGGGKPLAQAENKTPASGRGLFSAVFGPVRRAWNAVAIVLPDPARNREFWKFTWGQAFANIGGSFHYSALGKLLDPKGTDTKRVTDNRAINSAAQLGASVLTGPLNDRVSPRAILVWTYFGRALLMASIPVLFFHGYFLVAIFHAIIFAAGFLQSTGMTAGSVAFQRILGDDESHYNKANAVFNVVLSVTGVLAPLAAGAFIVAMDARFGFLAGNALCYAVYGTLLLATSLLYLTLRVPRGPPAAPGAQPAQLGLKARAKELAQGFRLIFRNRFLRMYLLFTTFSVMMADPIVFSALPRYLSDVLHLSSGMQAAAFSWFLAAASLGSAVTSLGMMFLKPKPEQAPQPGKLSNLEKQGRWSSILHGGSWLLYIGQFMVHSLPVSIAFMVASMMAAAPAMNIWSSLLQKVIGEETPQDMGKVYSSLFFYQLAFSIVGSLFFGWMMVHLSTATALLITVGVMAVMAGLDILEPYLVFPLARAKKDPPAKK